MKTKFKRFPTDVAIAHAKAHPATADYAFGERSGGYTITPPTKKSNRRKIINHSTAQKIVVGIQLATLVLELNDLLADDGKDKEKRAVGAIVTTLRDIRLTLRTRA